MQIPDTPLPKGLLITLRLAGINARTIPELLPVLGIEPAKVHNALETIAQAAQIMADLKTQNDRIEAQNAEILRFLKGEYPEPVTDSGPAGNLDVHKPVAKTG